MIALVLIAVLGIFAARGAHSTLATIIVVLAAVWVAWIYTTTRSTLYLALKANRVRKANRS